MKVEVIKWENQFIERSQSFRTEGTVTLRVTKTMIQNVIEKSKTTNWKIEKDTNNYLSNAQRNVYKMTITMGLIWLHDVLTNLEIGWVEKNGTIDYYRSGLENRSRYGKLTCVLVWTPNKGYSLQRRNFPVTYQSVYKGGKHFVAMNETYSL